MPSATSRFSIPKPSGTDPVADGDDTMRAMADRIDYCLGETIDDSITPSAANTKTTKVVNFGRTYKSPPRCLVSFGGDNAVISIAPGGATVWVDDVSTTTVTIALQSTGTGNRPVTILVRPKSTDVTP